MVNFFWKQRILIFIIILVCFSAFLRFYNLPNIYIFGFDEEYQATYAMTLVHKLHPIWIGVSASFLDYYLGPYFTYFTAFWLWLFHGDPLLTAYIAAAIGVVTSLVVFFVGRKFFNLTTGVVASLLYAGLPLFVFYDQKYWNPMFVQLIVLLMFTSLMLIKKSPWWWLLYSAMVGAIFETDLAPFPLIIIGIWLFIKGRYLFKAYGRTPAQSFTDKNFAWLYPKEVNKDLVDYNVILSGYGALPDRDLTGYGRIDGGGFSAYIKKLR